MENKNESAFPCIWDMRRNPDFGTEAGLTKREYAAIMAMQGLLANTSIDKEDLARYSIAAADELLKQLEDKQNAS
jgi:hypothetical protein